MLYQQNVKHWKTRKVIFQCKDNSRPEQLSEEKNYIFLIKDTILEEDKTSKDSTRIFFSALESMFKNQHLLDFKENRLSPIRGFTGLILEPHSYTPHRSHFCPFPSGPGRVHGSSLRMVVSRGRVGGGAKGTSVIQCLPCADTPVCPQPFLYFLLQFWTQPYRAIARHFGSGCWLFSPFLILTVPCLDSDLHQQEQATSLLFVGRICCILRLRFKIPFPSLGCFLSPPL